MAIEAFTTIDEQYMRRAVELAKTGEGRVSPNPPVGCVLVKNGVVVGEGWHDRLGSLHAEAMALKNAGAEAKGSTAYVTLSPCTTHGRQPPCADALIRAGVAKVLVAAPDPNPGNSAGIDVLNAAGIPARSGLLRDEAEYLARGFFSMMLTKMPYVTLKYAMTLDGKIAAASGDSKWISGPASRRVVHDMRSRHDAVLAGIGTALADNPLLNVREPTWTERGGASHKQPIRVIVDSRCRLPADAALLDTKTNPGGPVVVACVAGRDEGRAAPLRRAGADVWEFESEDGKVPLRDLLSRLGSSGVSMVLCESGGTLAAALLRRKLIDEIAAFIAPKAIGGNDAPGPLGDMGLERMADAVPLRVKECKFVENDILITSLVEK